MAGAAATRERGVARAGAPGGRSLAAGLAAGLTAGLAACRSPAPSIAPERAGAASLSATAASAAASGSAVSMDAPDSRTGARPRSSGAPTEGTSGGPAASVSRGSGAPAGACTIRIVAVEEAAVYAGPGADSPARQRTLEALSPQEREQWRGRDHAYTHLRCRYTVAMNGQRYRHERVAAQQLGFGRTLDPAQCAKAEEKSKVEAELVEATKHCTEPHARAYWGVDLIEPGR